MKMNLARPTSLAIATIVLAGCLPFVLTSPAHAATPPSHAKTLVGDVDQLDSLSLIELENAFAVLSSIPDSVLMEGDQATGAWLRENRSDLLRQSRVDVLGCAGAIAWLIASTAIPAAKILKIKRLLTALGGGAQAARVFWGASFSYEKIRMLGGAAAALGAELLGIGAVKTKCFA